MVNVSSGISLSATLTFVVYFWVRVRALLPVHRSEASLAVREPAWIPSQGAISKNKRIWDKFLTERDKAVFTAGGGGARAGFGKRPALLVIDVNWAFCGERPEPILESIKRWRTSCGEESWVALQYIRSLIEGARANGLPVIYTTGERRPDNWDAGSWRWKSTRSDEASGTAHYDIDGNEIVTMIAPGPKDILIKKQKPS